MNISLLRHIVLLGCLFVSTLMQIHGASLTFSGISRTALSETPNSSSGLDAIYVLPTVSNASASYKASTQNVKWLKWGMQGAAYATEIPASNIIKSGNSYTLTNIEGNCGYTIEDGSSIHYFWIVDYSTHPYSVSAVHVDDDSDCAMTSLRTEGTADRIYYYSINARAYEIDRDIHISYLTLKSDSESFTFNQVTTDESVAYINGSIHVPSPLCDTYLKVSGDKFMSAWGVPMECISGYYNTSSVEAIVNVMQEERENDNEQSADMDDTALGGSAPCDISMKAVVSDAAIFHEWQITSDPSFNDVLLRATELDYTHTFSEMGSYYIRFMCADASGKCEWYSDTYTVFIGESRLLCPNAFSPNASPGVNDEWKVSYRSLISFECYIFNKWGVKVAEFKDPAQGWDGKYNGKFVPAGVYYYVIKAEGADGVKYDLSGDINIVNYK